MYTVLYQQLAKFIVRRGNLMKYTVLYQQPVR